VELSRSYADALATTPDLDDEDGEETVNGKEALEQEAA